MITVVLKVVTFQCTVSMALIQCLLSAVFRGRRGYLSDNKSSLRFSNHLELMNRLHILRTIMPKPFSENFLLRQLFDRESCTYTYLLADVKACEAILIDPVIELAERDANLVKDLGLKLKYAINTHMHADHITGTGKLKKLIPGCKSIISQAAGAKADIYVENKDEIKFGSFKLEVRSTPGHTNGCVSYVDHDQAVVFTGDTLLVRGCGRTDFQEGSPERLYNSVYQQIFSLPDHYTVYPAHDYKGFTASTVGEEKRYNPRLTRGKEEFATIMNNLNLPYPKKIDESLPANKLCGLQDLPDHLKF